MAERALRVGQTVELTGKDAKGTIAFIGTTTFATGKWIGVVLDSPKGKNNGTVQGKSYFQCPDNHGVFVRHSQLTVLGETSDSPMSSPRPAGDTPPQSSKSTEKVGAPRSRLPVLGATAKGSSQGDLTELSVTPIKDAAQATDTASKRASFVETGFVETLKPQYTPGPALSPGMGLNIEERMTNLQQCMEIDKLHTEIRDLNEKLETLRVKRAQDKERLKEQDKLRLQLEQLLEWKSRIMESQAQLQRDLNRAKQEAREAIEAKEIHAEEMADLSETVEMATLDKEMAEEKAEALQMELDQAREQIETLTTDVELLKAQLQLTGEEGGDTEGGGDGMSDAQKQRIPSVIALEMKQLQQQNNKMRETLVRLRDLSAHEKHEAQKLLKELELRRSEIAELSRTKEKLSSRQEELEQTLAYLQEQVDAALGAEEMVENLTTKNLNLEERVKELEEAVADLEAIGDMNEQLQEGSRELELELREELDMAHSSHREAIRELEAAQETLADRDQTIKKFRELVQRLQDQSQDLQEQLQRETSRPLSALPEMIDFKKMFAESKAHTKAIDLELRRIDVQQSNQHVHFLTAYMPESFMARGGDHDAMLLLLLVPRLLRKADIVVEQVRDKFPAVPTVDRAAVLRSHAVEQFAFASRLSFWIYRLQSTLEQLMRALNSCSPDTLLRVGVLYSDLALQERAVDALVELLRHDQLDENASLEALEKCVGFCQAVMTTHLPPSSEPSLALPQQLVASCRALSAACDHLHTTSSSVLALMQSTSKPEKAALALQDVQCATDMLRQQLKQCRRRLTGPLPTEHVEKLVAAQEGAAKMIHALQDCLKACMQHITSAGDAESGMVPTKVLQLLQTAVTEHVTSESDVEMGQDLRNSLVVVETCVKNLSQAVHDGDYELESKLEEKVVSPILLRAQCVKKELEETKLLRQKLETREVDIKELKKVLKLKQEELGEMVIRKDLAESKLGNVHKDYAVNMEKLQRKLDDCQMMLRRKEKEFEETMDHLQADIDSLESERGELKEKLKSISKKALIEGLAKSVASSSGAGSLSSGVGPSLPVAVRDSPMLVQQISDLRLALRHLQNENIRLRTQAASKQLASLPPLKVCAPSLGGDRADVDNTRAQLTKQATTLLKDLQHTLANPMVVDISGRKAGEVPLLNKTDPMQQLAQRNVEMHELHARVDALQAGALEYMTSNKPGTRALSSFAAFPTVAFAKALQEEKAECVGRVSLVSKSTESTSTMPLLLDLASLRRLHASIAL